MATDEEEKEFSDDSLEVHDKHKKKVRKPKPSAKLNRPTYLQLYERRLTKEILNSSASILNGKILENSAKSESLQLESSKLKVNEGSLAPSKTDQKAIKQSKAQKNPLWSEFLSTKFKSQHPKSEANDKIEMLRKRLEYGRQMNSINKVNQMCWKSKEKIEAETTSKENSKKVSQVKQSREKLVESVSAVSKSAVKQKQENETTGSIKTIQKRLEKLNILHQKDKKLVESIRGSLKVVEEF